MRISDWSSDVCSSDLCVGPIVRPAVFDPTHLDVERMRLLDLAAPAQEILLGDEGEAIDPAAEAIELDAELDLRRCNRLVVAIGVNPEFRLHPVFEDRHLDRENDVAEQDRKHVGSGKGVSVQGELGGRVYN